MVCRRTFPSKLKALKNTVNLISKDVEQKKIIHNF